MCNMLQRVQCVAVLRSLLQCVAVCCNVLQCVAVYGSVLQSDVVEWQRVTERCN